jgi:hypothetical protein
MVTDQDTTLKIPTISSGMTETEFYLRKFRMAGDKMLSHFSKENVKEYEEAQKDLEEIEDLYRDAWRLLLERQSQELQRL